MIFYLNVRSFVFDLHCDLSIILSLISIANNTMFSHSLLTIALNSRNLASRDAFYMKVIKIYHLITGEAVIPMNPTPDVSSN